VIGKTFKGQERTTKLDNGRMEAVFSATVAYSNRRQEAKRIGVSFVFTVGAGAALGVPFDVTVSAVDAYGNIDTNYQGTVTFSTSDADRGVVLPADYTFQPSDQGSVTFAGGVTLMTPGYQALTVTDQAGLGATVWVGL
jgi:hypothetical protein